MSSIFLFVKCNGEWVENNTYKEKETIGILVPMKVTRIGLLQILYEELQLAPESFTLELKYETDGGFTPVKICNDRSLKAYLELKKNEPDKTKYTLCVDLSDQPMNNIVDHRLLVRNSVLRPQHVSALKSPPPTCESVNEELNVQAAPVEHVQFRAPPSFEFQCNEGLEDISPLNIPSVAEVGEEVIEEEDIEGVEEDEEVEEEEEEIARPEVPSEVGSRPSSTQKESNTVSSNESCDVIDMHSPITIKVNGMYASKRALQRHLQMYAIHNHFQFKVRTSKKASLHVVCRDENCKWSVRGT